MRFSRFKRAKEEVEVNLLPVMNLFVTLIPFLLLAAASYHVSVIPTSLPQKADDKTDAEVAARAVTVSLLIEKDRIELSASNAQVDKKTLAKLGMVLEKKDGKFDLEALSKVLYQIKMRYDQSDTLIVSPADEVVYRDVVEVLDTTREYAVNPGTEKEMRIPLFPVVVMSSKV